MRQVPLVVALFLSACGPTPGSPSGDGGGGGGDAAGDPDGGGNQGLCATLTCPEECDPVLGCVVCLPGTRRCEGSVSMVCDGQGQELSFGRDCADWSVTCGPDGYCEDLCADAERSSSNVGCEYWPVPLANTTEL